MRYMRVKIVIADIDECLGLLARPERFCSAQRLERCLSIRSEAARKQGYAAELALSYALSGSSLEPPVYCYADNGKPVIENGYVSLSHSGGYAVCAYADAPVGVDIEVKREVSTKIAARILCEAELAAYENGGGNDYLLERFVMKEAYFKMTGEGLGGGFAEVDTTGGAIVRGGEPAGSVRRFGGDEFFGYAVCDTEFDLSVIRISDAVDPAFDDSEQQE